MIKKKNMLVALVLVFFMSLILPAADTGLELGVSANYGLFSEADYDNGFGFSALVNFNLSKLFVLQIQGGMQMAETLNDPLGFDQGSLSLYPIQISFFLRVPIMKKMRFRIGGGGGYVFSNFKLDNEGNWDQLGFSLTQKLKAGLLYHAAAAFDFQVSDKMTLFAEGRYCTGQFDGEYEIRDRISNEIANGGWKEDLKYISLTVGLSISLKKTPSVQRFEVPERQKR